MMIPKDRLTEIGFEVLDYIYGELTIKKGKHWEEVFVDKDGVVRLGYNRPGFEKWSYLAYHYKDRDFFLTIIPVEEVDYRKALKAWMLERYKREAGTIAKSLRSLR